MVCQVLGWVLVGHCFKLLLHRSAGTGVLVIIQVLVQVLVEHCFKLSDRSTGMYDG